MENCSKLGCIYDIMVSEAFDVSIDKEVISFEQETILLSWKSFLPEVYFLEQRAKLFFLVHSLVLHRDSESIWLVLHLKPNGNDHCILNKSATSIFFLVTLKILPPRDDFGEKKSIGCVYLRWSIWEKLSLKQNQESPLVNLKVVWYWETVLRRRQ